MTLPRVLQFKDLRISPPVILAPMAGITTVTMRRFCERAGAGATFTEMISAAAAFRRVQAALDLFETSTPQKPFAVQIVGADPHEVGYTAFLAVERGAHWVDINMGCPAKDIIRGGAGAALMRDTARAEELVRSACRSVPAGFPVSVKIRAGWDEGTRNAVEFACRMVDAGACAVTVHGRTRSQMFTGRSDPGIIAEVVRAVPVPVIANGDVTSAETARDLMESTGAAGIMIGRASWGNPWLFARCRALFLEERIPDPPQPAERFAWMRQYMAEVLATGQATETACVEIQKNLAWMSGSIANSRVFRNRIFRSKSPEELTELIDQLEESVSAMAAELQMESDRP